MDFLFYKETFMLSRFTPTEEQLAILESFKHSRVLKINAIAGSGVLILSKHDCTWDSVEYIY